MCNYRRTLAKNIKRYRKLHNLTQFDFAEDCGISNGLVSMIERQNTNTTLDTLELIASYMGITLAELFTEDTPLP